MEEKEHNKINEDSLYKITLNKNKDIELIPVNIIDEGKQLAIRIPKRVIEALQIDESKDAFVFCFNKKDLILTGILADKETLKKGGALKDEK